VVAITRFSQFLTTVGVERIDQLDRRLLERYLADLARERLALPASYLSDSGLSARNVVAQRITPDRRLPRRV
jgi:hypothetical protein